MVEAEGRPQWGWPQGRKQGLGPRGEGAVGGGDRRLLEDTSLDGPRGWLVSLNGVGTRDRVAWE